VSSFETSPDVRIPSLAPGTDIRSLPIGPEEAFVLSRVDGSTNVLELSAATGVSDEHLAQLLARLEQLGAIQFAKENASEQAGVQAPDGRRPPALRPFALYDPAELDEAVDMDVDRRRKVLDTFYNLQGLNHYALLQVTQAADRKAIKSAYFSAVNLFHPDRYFGKNLGSFKMKLERVFAQITEAHDVLTRVDARADYDQYLLAQEKTRELERELTDSQRPDRLEQTLLDFEDRFRDTGASAPPNQPEELYAEGPTYDTTPDPEARRRAASRRLRAGSRGPAPRPSPQPISGAEQRASAAEGLRQRYEGRVNLVRQQQIEHYVKLADAALAANKPVSATSALRLALNLSGDDPALKARLAEVETTAHAEMSDTYLAQASYEERTGRFAEATRSYEKASRGKPTGKVFDKVAACALRAGDELHTAVEFARKAVRLEPDVVRYRQTLIQAYLAAGLKTSAIAEIDRAQALAPEDEQIKDWLKRAKHGEL